MIAVALIGIGILASIQTFTKIHEAIQTSKGKTLATTIGQEKMQTIMQKSYYEVLVTTDPAYRTVQGTAIPYDPSYIAPEDIVEGGIRFTRYTYVQVVQENSGSFVVLPPTTPDTGLRQVTVTVVWSTSKGERFSTMRSVVNNPSTVMARSILRGTVTNANTGVALADALVNAAENVGWQDTTSATGSYLINLSPGTFNFVASAPGFYSATVVLNLTPNGSVTQNFSLVPISSGTVRGTVWTNDHLTVSQVVGSSEAPVGSGFYQEYVEVFNPTTWTWTMSSGGAAVIDLKYHRLGGALTTIPITTYNVATIAPGGYYLFANTGTVTAVGVSKTADALYSGNYIEVDGLDALNDAAAVGIAWRSTSQWIDAVGWTKGSNSPPFGEGAPISQASYGLENDEQFVRKTSTSGVQSGQGRAYDSADNQRDFAQDGRQPMIYPPYNSSDLGVIVAGTPATGSVVTISDGLSTATTAYSAGNPPYAEFLVPGVASGTWTVILDSGAFSLEISSVIVTGNTTTSIPNAATTPAWKASGYFSSILSSSGVMGMICGTVKDSAGLPISGSLSVMAGSAVATLASSGYYCLRTSTGIYDVIANSGNGNSMYASATQTGVTVALGDVTASTNFYLSKGGKVSGWMTRDGTNALPGMTVVAKDSNGYARDTQVTGANGSFLMVNLTTGTYTIEPVLDMKETASPANASVVVSAGATTWSSTFTITGAMGTVAGSVTSGGAPIKSGVLVIVSTGTVSLPPPTLSSNTLNSAAYYADSSSEDGTYSVDVRGSSTTTYNVYGYYMYLSGITPVISSRTITGVTVNSGLTTSGVNFSW